MAKTTMYVQYQGHEVEMEDLISTAKSYWKQAGKKIGAIEKLDLYVKPEEFCAYYNINDDEQKGKIDF